MTNTKLRNQLRILGWGATDSGDVVPYRAPSHRYEHERLGVMCVHAPKDLVAKVVAALDEPAALVGVSATHTLMLFRIGKINTPPQPLQFFTDKQYSMSVSITCGPIDVAAYQWLNDRSPLNVRLADLPPLFPDEHHAAAENAILQGDVRRGIMATVLAEEKAAAERLEKTRQEIREGYWTDAAVAQREQEALVARYEGVEISQSFPSEFERRVISARRAVAARKAEAGIVTTAA